MNPWSPHPAGPHIGHWDAKRLTDRAEIEACREALEEEPLAQLWRELAEFEPGGSS